MPAKKKQRATLDALLKKPARTKEVTIHGDAGDITVLFKSIGSRAYDEMISAHPPTKEQEKRNLQWNEDTFPPALVAACSVDPKIDPDSAVALFESDDWSKGELMDLFIAVVKLNGEGLDIPFTEDA